MLDDRIVAERSYDRVAQFRARVAVLFERLPMLCGFHVTTDLTVVEIAVDSWPGCAPTGELVREICAALEDLIAERADDTVDLLRGRTFARAVH